MPDSRQNFEFNPKGPFSLATTVDRLVRFREVVHQFEDDRYRVLVPVGSRLLLVSITQEGPVGRAALRIEVSGKDAKRTDARAAGEQVATRVLGAGVDLRPFCKQFKDDKLLASPLKHSRGLRVSGGFNSWETIVTAVLSQQVNLQLAYRIRQDLCLTYGRRARIDGESFLAFPKPERIAKEKATTLRKFGLSQSKAETLIRVGTAFAKGDLDDDALLEMPDEEVIEILTEIKGIGRWTADVTLMRGLSRADAFPGGDLGVVKYLAKDLFGKHGTAKEGEMRKLAERWSPYRGVALVYLYAEIMRRRQAG